LGYPRGRQAKPLWIGVVSFFLGLNPDNYIVEKTGFNELLPIIVQIQGPADWSYDAYRKYKDAKRILGTLRWEKALVTIVLGWAERNRIPAVYLLPSLLNKYRDPDNYSGPDNRNKKLFMRYDVTAKRMGFELQENGLFRALVDVSSNGDSPQS